MSKNTKYLLIAAFVAWYVYQARKPTANTASGVGIMGKGITDETPIFSGVSGYTDPRTMA
jgi:hypothetical protein